MSKQPGHMGGLQPNVLDDTPQIESLLLEGFWVQRLGWLLMAALAWNGLALELLVLW